MAIVWPRIVKDYSMTMKGLDGRRELAAVLKRLPAARRKADSLARYRRGRVEDEDDFDDVGDLDSNGIADVTEDDPFDGATDDETVEEWADDGQAAGGVEPQRPPRGLLGEVSVNQLAELRSAVQGLLDQIAEAAAPLTDQSKAMARNLIGLSRLVRPAQAVRLRRLAKRLYVAEAKAAIDRGMRRADRFAAQVWRAALVKALRLLCYGR